MGNRKMCGTPVAREAQSRSARRALTESRGFGAARQARFIEVLAATCSVERASERCGADSHRIYEARRCDPAFAAAWDAALANAYDRLEVEALRYALGRLPGTSDAGHGHATGASGSDAVAGSPGTRSAATERRVSDADLRFVLAILARGAKAGRGAEAARVLRPSEVEVDARLVALLDTLERRTVP